MGPIAATCQHDQQYEHPDAPSDFWQNQNKEAGHTLNKEFVHYR